MIISNYRTDTGALRFFPRLPSAHRHSAHSFPCSGFLLFLLVLFAVSSLPPSEEGSSALETLCVGLTVGSLRCSGCFDDYWGHLDQLKGRLTIL